MYGCELYIRVFVPGHASVTGCYECGSELSGSLKISCADERLLACQEGLWYMEFLCEVMST